ncbi:MAG TPA: hypothetical protein VFQ38_23945 [Longimicrobiales bacterium]|nr:hypothetical protein [Longimicrobiales bacterium]
MATEPPFDPDAEPPLDRDLPPPIDPDAGPGPPGAGPEAPPPAWRYGDAARAVLSVLVGYAVFAIAAAAFFNLADVDPHEPASTTFMAVSTVYGVVFAFLGGGLAATLARHRAAAWGVAAVLALGALVSLLASPADGAVWSQIAALVAMAPAAAAGGLVLRRRWKATSG